MNLQNLHKKFKKLNKSLAGDLFFDDISRILYSTDASVYKEKPLAVVYPVSENDIKKLILFANQEKISIIPRTAGTSVAGQVVGGGIVVDVSRYMTKIIELNLKENWIKVQPGVIPDELNAMLEPYGLFFGPETSTSNRCMIGGMVGNNSCGLHSIVYGSTREHTLSLKLILSDGSKAEFSDLTLDEFQNKKKGNNLESEIYRNIDNILSNPENQQIIRREYPHKSIKRRNTGYAIDILLDTEPFSKSKNPFNFSKLITGSEGTLAFITEIKLNLVPLPPEHKGLFCIHFNSVDNALKANLFALKYDPSAVELIDNIIIDCTKNNPGQSKNRFFIKGDPAAILIIEFCEDSKGKILEKKEKLEKDLQSAGLGFHFPIIFGDEIKKVWALRKAGLGVLSNIPGDKKPVTVSEDTSVKTEDLPGYIEEYSNILQANGLNCVYYGHVATGELHLRPVLDLKDPKDVETFRLIGQETARIVKKYNGSLSGEHGDGRLRGEFIPLMIGETNYNHLKQIKKTWDPNNIFNPFKIIDTPPMNTSLRYLPDHKSRNISTIFDFSKNMGIIRAAENCNGSGDCRKTEKAGGIMCPSYMASRDERNSTRARANILREFLTNSPLLNPFAHKEIYEIMDLCLSCKGCKLECPSNVDITKLKAEFLQHYYEYYGTPFRTKLIANITRINKIGSIFPSLFNFFITNRFFSWLIKKSLGFASKRHIPTLHKTTLRKWIGKNPDKARSDKNNKVYLFIDEFTNYNDVQIGIATIGLLSGLGYNVETIKHKESGRTYLSKGLLKKAKAIANDNLRIFRNIINENTPLIGIEPSALLTFRDEYPDLANDELKESASVLSKHCFMIDEFLAREIETGNISHKAFISDHKNIKLHAHCYQKAHLSTEAAKIILSLPQNYKVEEIKSGCCGMAGSFGFEKEHYELSIEVGELVLFPEIRNSSAETLIAAPGTSCRQQIKDGTGVTAYHPVEILYNALKK